MEIDKKIEDFRNLVVKKLDENPSEEEKFDLLKPFHDGFFFHLTFAAEDLACYCSPISWCDVWYDNLESKDADFADNYCMEIWEDFDKYYREVRLPNILQNMSMDELNDLYRMLKKWQRNSKTIQTWIEEENLDEIQKIRDFMIKFDMIWYNWYDKRYADYFMDYLLKAEMLEHSRRLNKKANEKNNKGDIMTKDINKFGDVLESYVYLRECCAVRTERAELDLDEDIYDLKDYCDSLTAIAKKHDIRCLEIKDNSSFENLNEYSIYLENKLDNELKYKLSFMYMYDK